MLENEPSFPLNIWLYPIVRTREVCFDTSPEVGMPEALEPSESDTMKRRVESFDESVDWFQRERSSILWLTNSSDERDILEIDVGDPLKSEKSFCRDSLVVVKEIVRWEID